MFEHHFGLRENPFPAGHQLKFVYPSREHMEARAHLRYGIENREPFLLITGEVGTGKTTSLYDALHEWGDRVAVALITNSALTRQEMLEEICLRFGIDLPPGVSKPALLALLEKYLVSVRARGENAVLMMDEAQNLSMDLLEEIRLLSNLEHRGDKLLQIFLVGQPELEAHLARHELRQLRQRITVHYRLNPLSPEETLGYIQHHINVAGGVGPSVFPADACREIYRLSHGIPREINTLASSALIAAYADGSPCVEVEHISTVAHEGDFKSVLSGPRVSEGPPAPSRPLPPAAAPSPPVAPPSSYGSPPASTPPRSRIAQSTDFTWPPLPELATGASRPATPAPTGGPMSQQRPSSSPSPAPSSAQPAAPAAGPSPYGAGANDPYAVARERGEITRGLMAAMRRAEAPPPPEPPAHPTPQPMARPQFAQRPAQPPAPIPLHGRAAQQAAIRPVPAPVPPPVMAALAPSYAPMEPADAPAQPDFSSLSPQLRKRVEREMSRGDVVSKSMRNGLIAVSVVATVAIMFILLQRFGAIDWPVMRGSAGRQAAQGTSAGPDGGLITPAKAPDPTAAIIDSLKREVETAKRNPPVRTISTGSHEPEPARSQAAPVVDQLDLDAPALPPENEAPARKEIVTAPAKHESAPAPAKSESAQAPAMNETVPVPAKAAANDSFYGVGVAAFLDAERAREEKDRLVRDTSLPGVVMPFKDEGTTMYRVVLGHWSTSSDAERAANGLMEKGLINEARVVTFPKK